MNKNLLKYHLLSMQTQNSYWKKYPYVITIHKNLTHTHTHTHTHTKIQRLAIHYLHTVPLTTIKTSMISTEKASFGNNQLQEKRNVTFDKVTRKEIQKIKNLSHMQTRIP